LAWSFAAPFRLIRASLTSDGLMVAASMATSIRLNLCLGWPVLLHPLAALPFVAVGYGPRRPGRAGGGRWQHQEKQGFPKQPCQARSTTRH
jgi:hypothetical protein